MRFNRFLKTDGEAVRLDGRLHDLQQEHCAGTGSCAGRAGAYGEGRANADGRWARRSRRKRIRRKGQLTRLTAPGSRGSDAVSLALE